MKSTDIYNSSEYFSILMFPKQIEPTNTDFRKEDIEQRRITDFFQIKQIVDIESSI